MRVPRPSGLAAIARRTHAHARALADGLANEGVDVQTATFFDTVTVAVPGRAAEVVREAANRGVNLWRVDDDRVSISADETTGLADLEAVWAAFGVTGDIASRWPPRTARVARAHQ